MLTQEPTVANHPITPPPELVSKWANMFEFHSDAEVFSEVARWGSDTELEACCEVMRVNGDYVSGGVLRAIRRPKPPSLKEQALDELASAERLYPADWSTIRRALEALPND
jgi:hypothetical protein